MTTPANFLRFPELPAQPLCLSNRFVTQAELIEFLSATDIHITPYLQTDQSTSGTLAHAVGAGKAIMSTPYVYARELLAYGRGVRDNRCALRGISRDERSPVDRTWSASVRMVSRTDAREGDVGYVAFPCGSTRGDDKDTINLYYGAADTSVALATGSVRELLAWLDRFGTKA